MPPLSREQLGARVMQLPPGLRHRALEAIKVIYPPRVDVDGAIAAPSGLAPRDAAQRRKYANDPWAYFRDIFGYWLTPDQEEALALIEKFDRVLLPSGNNTGKSWLLGAYGAYRLDAVAALPDESLGVEEQGGQLLLPGPDHQTIFSTIYQKMLSHARRAESRGFAMPGRRSENSVLWRAGPHWQVEAFSPKLGVGEGVSAGASGRHHRNQVAVIEEGQGVAESIWLGTEGMCSGTGNKIISSFNPIAPRGPAYKRSRGKTYVSLHISALNHPNVRERREVVSGAIGVDKIDARVRSEECLDMGPAASTVPDAEHHDFVYACPVVDAPEIGPRTDGVLGHPNFEPHVYRPGDTFVAQVLGQWPKTSSASLFDPAACDRATARWLEGRDPATPPDNVGIDPAREGRDSSGTAPRWGRDAEPLLREYAEAVRKGDARKVDALRAERQRVGVIQIIPKGDGVFVAEEVRRRFPSSPFTCDDGGVGASVLDHLRHVLMASIVGVSFGGGVQEPTPGEPWSENTRTQLYVRAARMLAFGLVDMPNDPQLREELLVHTTKPKSRTVTVLDDNGVERKVRVSSLLLLDKDSVKKLLGRSPDRADTFVLAVNGDPAPKPTPWEVW
jgi:hypothetical protein